MSIVVMLMVTKETTGFFGCKICYTCDSALLSHLQYQHFISTHSQLKCLLTLTVSPSLNNIFELNEKS